MLTSPMHTSVWKLCVNTSWHFHVVLSLNRCLRFKATWSVKMYWHTIFWEKFKKKTRLGFVFIHNYTRIVCADFYQLCSFKNISFLSFISKYNWELHVKNKKCQIECFIFSCATRTIWVVCCISYTYMYIKII